MKMRQIINALERVKTLKDATLDEMAVEIRKTSTCVVVDAAEIKASGKWLEIHNKKIGTFIEDESRHIQKIQCSFQQFVSQNITAAREGGTTARFVKDARLLASMLEKAAKRVEREAQPSDKRK